MGLRLLDENFMHQLGNNSDFNCLKDLFGWLCSNFDASPQLLKKCIFYLSIFSQDKTIRRKRLVRRWIAEGYCKGTSSSGLEEEVGKLIHKLVDLCIMQPQKTITVSGAMRMTCQVNSLFLEHIIASRQAEDKTFLPLEVSVLGAGRSLATEHVGQHLAIHNSWERDEFVYRSLDLSRLRSLTVPDKWRPFFISEKMRVLRVLDLEGTMYMENGELKRIVELLVPRLKFLSLRGCGGITCLPESVGELRQLETLDIRHTSIPTLPKSIIRLKKLQYIRGGRMQTDLSFPDFLTAAPQGAAEAEVEAPPAAGHAEELPVSARAEAEFPAAPGVCAEAEVEAQPLELLPTLALALAEAEAEAEAQAQALAPGRAEAEELLPTPREEAQAPATQGAEELRLTTPPGAEEAADAPARKVPPTKPRVIPISWSYLLAKLRRSRSAGDSTGGVAVPQGMASLTALRTIGVLNVNNIDGIAFLKDLGKKLPQLRKLAVCGLRRGLTRDVLSSISRHESLECLSVQAEDLIWGNFTLPPNLVKFSLVLTGTLGQSAVNVLMEHKKLRTLRLGVPRVHARGKVQFFPVTWGAEVGGGFDGLKVLEIACKSSLQAEFSEKGMQKLEVLKVHCRGGVALEISGLKDLKALKQVWLVGSCEDELLQNALRDQLDGHPKKPVLKVEGQQASSS